MNIERTYSVIGKDGAKAKFIVSIMKFLQIDFVGSACKFRAPFDKLSISNELCAGAIKTTRVTYKSNSDLESFWEVAVTEEDGNEIQKLIQEAEIAHEKL